MLSTDVAIRETGQDLVRLDTEQIKFLANTEFVPRAIRGNLPAIFATIATGREIGIGDMAALRHVHLIDGKPGYSAEIMVALARRAGHSIEGEITEGRAIVRGRRGDNGNEITSTWTLEMAKRAGLAGKQVWQKYPEAMLWARAVSQLIRMLCPEVTAGATYTQEELEDSAGGPEAGEVAPGAPVSSHDQVAPDDAAPPADVDLSDPDIPFGDAPPVVPPISEPQKKKLNVMVKSTLAERVPLPRIYATVAEMRGWTKDELIAHVGGVDSDGTLHFSPLRDALSKHEATVLIDKLEQIEAAA